MLVPVEEVLLVLPPRTVSVRRGSLPVPRRRPLFESSEPYFETDKILGKFTGCAQLHQFLYTRLITPSLGLRYLLRAFSGYRVEIVHSESPS